MHTDRKIIISEGASRRSARWKQVATTWRRFCERLADVHRFANITTEQYHALPKSQKDELKDVGGFVGGQLDGERRKAEHVTGRDLITLDLDTLPPGSTDSVIKAVQVFGAAAVIYSTAKHRPDAPRLRVVILLKRTVTRDEYCALARMTAKRLGLGLEAFDPFSFSVHQLMYWPACPSDAVAVYYVNEAPALDPDLALAMWYDLEGLDWHDVRTWPTCPGEGEILKKETLRLGDPKQKPGWVGYFCQVYDVPAAIEKYLPGIYLPAGGDRYTFAGAESTAGAVIYNGGWFLYSNHASDPAGGHSVNAFDLVRIHLFGAADEEAKEGTPANRLPSYLAMRDLCEADPEVRRIAVAAQVSEAFAQPVTIPETGPAVVTVEPSTPILPEWLEEPQLDKAGGLKTTTNNIMLKFETDPDLRGSIRSDLFLDKIQVVRPLPWDPWEPTERQPWRQWTDADDVGFRVYAEARWGLYSIGRTADAVVRIAKHYATHSLRDYLNSLTWDGVPRVETIFSDYLGADDTIYTREVARITLRAAVARAMEDAPVKFDYMPVLVGPQGCGKSTLVRHLAKRWGMEGLGSFGDAAAMEAIQGKWIVEVSEMAALSRADDAAAKQFLSKTVDSYRAPYGRATIDHPRRAVFFGTVNEQDFLRDTTGNRRYWPIEVGKNPKILDVFEGLPNDVDQIWAEAVQIYRRDGPEDLRLSEEAASIAEIQQENHTAGSELDGIVREFLDLEVPEAWNGWDIAQKRLFYISRETDQTPGKAPIQRVTAAEFFLVGLGGRPERLSDSRVLLRGVNNVIRKTGGWTWTRLRVPDLGVQWGFVRAVP